jgi:hypothetical protein
MLDLCRRDDLEAIFYTLVALLNMKLSRLSSYKRKQMSDNDLISGMQKENKESAVEKGQRELKRIKEIKSNLQPSYMKSHLPGKHNIE